MSPEARAEAAAATFELHRGRLLGLGYRMLGSRAEAEDVVQEAWLRWSKASTGVGNPEAFLVRVATRLCLDRLKSAARRREVYKGPWLPEPVLEVDELSPHSAAELADDLSFALLLALERLSGAERAAFLLHDVFDVPFAEVAEVLQRSEPTCRKLASRARRAVRSERPTRLSSSAELAQERDRLLAAFVEATGGNVAPLEAMLAEDAVLLSDGGGQVPAALLPILGRDKIVRLLMGLARQREAQGGTFALERREVNGEPGLVMITDGELEQTISFDVSDGAVGAIYIVRNPQKLRRVRSQLHG